MNYQSLEKAICSWAGEQEDIRSVVRIGSRARKRHPADSWSDLDLILFVDDPQIYAGDPSWLFQFGEIWLYTGKITGIGDPEWLVLYETGLKVDFLLAPVTGSLPEMLYGKKYGFVTSRGVQILLDKNGLSSRDLAQDAYPSKGQKAGQAEFTAAINQFWLTAYRVANMLRRDELWRAKDLIDGELRRLLLHFLEWQAKAAHGDSYEVWHDGRYLKEWLDPQWWAALPGLYAPFDREETTAAFLRLLNLADELGKDIAERWRCHYPTANINHVRGWIVTALSN